ncbi:hypothetical protein MRB53_026312 [Persea americana]|uniref:Uncharacterized protein n=1 Tax=Persea americana TaxID=3435 RepID=A0ACC2LIC1_PERAE|nr:hypothetical protein MRB53_026312 [Persea americana]
MCCCNAYASNKLWSWLEQNPVFCCNASKKDLMKTKESKMGSPFTRSPFDFRTTYRILAVGRTGAAGRWIKILAVRRAEVASCWGEDNSDRWKDGSAGSRNGRS